MDKAEKEEKKRDQEIRHDESEAHEKRKVEEESIKRIYCATNRKRKNNEDFKLSQWR